MDQAIFQAIIAGDADEVRRLLKEQPALIAARAPNGVSAILFAIYHRRPDIAHLFTAQHAVLDIFEASALGRVDRIGELLEADPSLASAFAPDGFYPLGLAAFFGHLDAVRALLDAGADVHAVARNPFKVQPLHAAAASRDVRIIWAVLDAGADVNARQQEGYTPLHEAASSGNREIAELLLAHGADPRQANDAGKSSIDLAREKGHVELAERLTR